MTSATGAQNYLQARLSLCGHGRKELRAQAPPRRFSASQVTGLAPMHVPAWHVSVWVQALLSLHAVPFAAGKATQAPVTALHSALGPHTGKRLSPRTCQVSSSQPLLPGRLHDRFPKRR